MSLAGVVGRTLAIVSVVCYAGAVDSREGLLSADEVARRLGVTPATVRVWTREGLLQAVRLRWGKRGILRYEPKDVEHLVQRAKGEV